jgi:hypothetical protein
LLYKIIHIQFVKTSTRLQLTGQIYQLPQTMQGELYTVTRCCNYYSIILYYFTVIYCGTSIQYITVLRYYRQYNTVIFTVKYCSMCYCIAVRSPVQYCKFYSNVLCTDVFTVCYCKMHGFVGVFGREFWLVQEEAAFVWQESSCHC